MCLKYNYIINSSLKLSYINKMAHVCLQLVNIFKNKFVDEIIQIKKIFNKATAIFRVKNALEDMAYLIYERVQITCFIALDLIER